MIIITVITIIILMCNIPFWQAKLTIGPFYAIITLFGSFLMGTLSKMTGNIWSGIQERGRIENEVVFCRCDSKPTDAPLSWVLGQNSTHIVPSPLIRVWPKCLGKVDRWHRPLCLIFSFNFTNLIFPLTLGTALWTIPSSCHQCIHQSAKWARRKSA